MNPGAQTRGQLKSMEARRPIRLCAIVSEAIYGPALMEELQAIGETGDGLHLSSLKHWWFAKNSLQGGIVWHDNIAYVAIRGTDERADWSVNLDTTQVYLTDTALGPEKPVAPDTIISDNLPFAAVHEGFAAAAQEIWPIIQPALNESRPGRVFFTGHSLGGAVALGLYTKALFSVTPWMTGGAVTFGAPRFGNAAYAAMMEACLGSLNLVRVVNNNDLVTRVPMRIGGYRHVETDLLYFREDGELHYGALPWWTFLDRLEGAAKDLFERGLDGVKDHQMREYRTRTLAALPLPEKETT